MTKRKVVAMWFLVICVALQLVFAGLPRSIVAEVRKNYTWIGQPIDWLEASVYQLNVVHILVFIVVGIAARLAFPRVGVFQLFGLMLFFAVVTEVLQFLVPGRTPRLEDILADASGAILGLLLVCGFCQLKRMVSFTKLRRNE